jgi:GR25 family glycosyltransferase involved in LPS biosynthesis
MSEEISVIVIFIIILLLFTINSNAFITYSNTALGKLFAILLIIFYTHFHIGLGIFILLLVILYYKFYGNYNTDLNSDTNYLDGIDCIYWINLDRSTDRKRKMETLFKDPNFTGKPIQRISAIDGKTDTLHDKIKMKNKRNTNVEYACLISHLNTIKQFSETEYDTALIFEDDVTLEFKPFWKKSLKKIINDAPNDWEIIQLCYITQQQLTNEYTLNNYKKNRYGGIASMAAYIINNNAAKKFINETYDVNTKRYRLLDYHTHEADHYLYKCLRTYTYKYPYFIYPTDNNSTLHPEDLNSHIRSKLQLERMYKHNRS